MIVRMSKISIVGPKELAMTVMAALQQIEGLHIDPTIRPADDDSVKSCAMKESADPGQVTEKLFYEELLQKIDSLLEPLSGHPAATSSVEPSKAIEPVSAVINTHLKAVTKLSAKYREAVAEQAQLAPCLEFLAAISPLLPAEKLPEHLAAIGFILKKNQKEEALAKLLDTITDKKSDFSTTRDEKGTICGVIILSREDSVTAEDALGRSSFQVYHPPPVLAALPLPSQRSAAEKRIAACRETAARIEYQLANFCKTWGGIYLAVRDWLARQLHFYTGRTSMFETDMCFFLCGWLPSNAVPFLREVIRAAAGDTILVEEQQILDRDLEFVPTILKNAAYFQPFEIFSRMLPMPAYTSFDITPFIGIFFPIFFGVMLGDAGYGFLLMFTAITLLWKYGKRPIISAAAKVLGVCSVYTIIVGILFGELFGHFGAVHFSMEPFLFDRHTALLPMLYFSLALGAIHIIIGLVLGGLTAFRKRSPREGAFKMLSILVILCLAGTGASYALPSIAHLKSPLLVVVAAAIMLLIITGGFLAPLELLKSIGNIISYARIMAIGLTSVLLAHVANHLAGTIGSIWLGILAGTLLHAFNIILGLFAPTIHGLRLHFVEFFGKFMEPGAQKTTPLPKPTLGGPHGKHV